ncbi:hypothetical protein GCM10022393_21780 [Aquimarina addita]|uniref:Fibronectin type-III domain-containing protein n=1 Tax=Aquimarina addita TaxID=870485 RepID=A0ABP6UIQ6_9FLAO
MNKQLHFLFLLLLFPWISLISQTFPVTVVPQTVPPAPIYLSSYADASSINSPLRVQLILNDLFIGTREVKLKAYFEGNGITFETNDIITGAPSLFLEGGVPLLLTNVELAPYFAFGNVSGISPSAYGQVIPEGSYQFCFEVYDALTGVRISQKSCASTYIFQNEPPLLVTPYNQIDIEEQNPINLLFQWTPRHINVSNVQYELSMVEIWDQTINPQAAFLASPPIFQTTTTNTSYLYSPADPLLLSNKRYAWRVQAKALNGAEEIGLFKNNGFSEIYWFNYTAPCDMPTNVYHEVKGAQQTNIFWDDFTTDIPEFIVRYREKGNGNEWFFSRTTSNWLTLWDLRAGATYEYQVKKTCLISDSDFSTVQTFTTLEEDDASGLVDCGISPDMNIELMVPLEQLLPGGVFKAGDFPVKVMEASGSSGRFTGKGYVSFPYFNSIKIAVTFTNIFINSENQLAEGTVLTVYDATWGNILNVDDVIDVAEDIVDVFTGDDVVPINLDYEIDANDISVTDGQIVITKPDGSTDTHDHDEGDTYTITDASGDEYTIDKDGNVTQTGQGDPSPALTNTNTDGFRSGDHAGTIQDPYVDLITNDKVKVTFKTGEDTRFALDLVNNDYENATYPRIPTTDGTTYYPPHKAAVQGERDIFYADIEITDAKINIDSLIIKTVDNTAIPHERIEGTNTYKITVTGVNPYQNKECVVTYLDTDNKYKIAASFFIHHIVNQKEIPVQVVTVNGGNNISNLETGLTNIFGKAGGKFKVKPEVIDITITQDSWDTGDKNGIIDYDGSGLLSDYPTELKNIYQEFKKQYPYYDSQQYFIFVLSDDFTVSKPLSGFMPKTRQWGFVFEKHLSAGLENKGSALHVAAHELGHGVFTLGHPFGENIDNAGEASTWLMDYGSGTELGYPNWATMSDPDLDLFLFQDDAGGELSGRIFLTSDWKPFTFENESTLVSPSDLINIPNGAIRGIKYKGETFKSNGNSFTTDAGVDLEGIKYLNLSADEYVYLFKYIKPCDNELYKTKWRNARGLKGTTIDYTSDIFEAKVAVRCKEPETNNICSNFTLLDDTREDHKSRFDYYQTEIDKALEKALSGIENTKTIEVRAKGNYNHIQFANITNPDILDQSKNFDILEDKLHLLTHYTKDTYMVVTLLTIDNNTTISNTKLTEMADISLKNKQSLVAGKKVVHVVISFSDYESIFGVGLFNNDACYNISYSQNSSNIIQPSKIETGVTPFTDILSFYSTIEKPLNLFATVVKGDGSFDSLEKRSRNNVRGFPLINSLETLKSPYLKILKEIKDEKPKALKKDAKFSEKLEYELEFAEWKKRYDENVLLAGKKDHEAIFNNTKDYFELVEGAIELREVYITNESFKSGLQMRYGAFHFDKSETFEFVVKIEYTFGTYDILNTKTHFYDGDINRNDVIYGMIDAGSLIFAPIGGDIIFDFTGLLFASYNQDGARATEYAAGVVLFSYAQYGAAAYKQFKLIKAGLEGSSEVKYSLKEINAALDEGEELVVQVIGRNIDDAKYMLKADGFVINTIEGVGDIVTSNHMIVLGGDIATATSRLSKIETKTTDGVIDIVIHGADNKLIVDGVEITDYIKIKKYLQEQHPNNKTVRLLSCTSLEGAQSFASALGNDFIVHATDGYIRVHNDGFITNVPREIGGDTKWYQLTEGKKEVLPDNLKPRAPDGIKDADYLDDFLELSTRTVDDINWAKLNELSPDLVRRIENKFTNVDEKAKFVADILHKTRVTKPVVINAGDLLIKRLDDITDAHIDAWKVLQDFDPLAKSFSNLDGFSNILPSFNKLTKAQQDDFLKTISTNKIYSDTKPFGSVKKDDLLVYNLKNLEEEHIDIWLELRKYGDEVNTQFNYKMIDEISLGKNTVENAVIHYGKRGENLAALLQKFGYENCYASVRQAGNVSTNNKKLLATLSETEFDRVRDLYKFNVDGVEYVVEGKDWTKFFNDLVTKGNFNGFQSHHILVIELFKSPGFRKWYEAKGLSNLDINGEKTLDNLIMLEGFVAGKGVHANHIQYNDALITVLNERWNIHLLRGEDVAIDLLDNDIKNIQKGIKKLLEEKSVKGTFENGVWLRTKVDDLISSDGSELFQMLD